MRQKCLEVGNQQTDGMTPKNGNKKNSSKLEFLVSNIET